MEIRRVYKEEMSIGYIYIQGVFAGIEHDSHRIIYDPYQDCAVVDPDCDYEWVYMSLPDNKIRRAEAVVNAALSVMLARRKLC